jgi:hypothetical protein
MDPNSVLLGILIVLSHLHLAKVSGKKAIIIFFYNCDFENAFLTVNEARTPQTLTGRHQ